MLPDSGCSDPECVQGRLGHCNTHIHKPWKPKPQYAGRNHPCNKPQTSPSGRCTPAYMYQGVSGSHHHTHNTPIVSGGVYDTANMYNGTTGSMVAPIARSFMSPGKGPSVAEEAEGPGAGPLDDTEQDCSGAARRLTQVMNWMRDNGHTGAMLRDFAHSDSCNISACSPFCRMFRRVRRHVQVAQHPCMLLRTYAVLLRLHVQSCTDEECGLRACPTLRNRHLAQNPNNQQEDRSSDVDMPEH